MRPEPKFSPGEPAIEIHDPRLGESEDRRVNILHVEWHGRGECWAYRVLPESRFKPGWLITEKYLRPLPPEELARCRETEEIKQPKRDEVTA